MTDPNLPGPDLREMRQLAREGVLIAGGARAILLQVAHPGVGRGVARHSDFAHRPLDRLRTTLTYVYAVTFGTPAEVDRVTSIVNAVHRKVIGPGYDASDPELQLWVAATLYETAMKLYEEIFGPFDDTVAETIYQQYAVLGTALQVPAAMWPADRAGFTAYWDDMVASVEVTDEARGVARDLLGPTGGPAWLRAGAPLNRFLTTAWLPPRLRSAYDLPWDAHRQRRYQVLMKAGHVVYPHLPIALREAPKTYYLRDLRRRLDSGKRVIAAPTEAA